MFNIKCKKNGRLGRGLAESNTKQSLPKTLVKKRSSYRFTLNNYTENDPADLASAFLRIGNKKYVFQEEICPKTKTPHLQGCVFFNNAIAFNTMKKINKRINWQRLDFPKAAIKYCLKSTSRKPGGRQWYNGINPKDYEEKPIIPLMDHKAMCKDMARQMIEDCKKELKEELDKLAYKNLWNSKNYGFGDNV